MRRPSFDMRSVLSAVGCALCIGSVLLAPLAASQPTLLADAVRLGAQDERVPTISLDRTTLLKQVTLVRDPFVEPAEVASRLKFERAAHSTEAAIVVEGIIDGSRPRALVRFGTNEQIIAIGDTLAGDTVVDIGSSGVRFSSGRTLRATQRTTP